MGCQLLQLLEMRILGERRVHFALVEDKPDVLLVVVEARRQLLPRELLSVRTRR